MKRRVELPTVREQMNLTPEMKDFLDRRTSPFLNPHDLKRIPLPHILQEVYMQGARDCMEMLELTERLKP